MSFTLDTDILFEQMFTSANSFFPVMASIAGIGLGLALVSYIINEVRRFF